MKDAHRASGPGCNKPKKNKKQATREAVSRDVPFSLIASHHQAAAASLQHNQASISFTAYPALRVRAPLLP